MNEEERAAYNRKAIAHVEMVKQSIRALILSADPAAPEELMERACDQALRALVFVIGTGYGLVP